MHLKSNDQLSMANHNALTVANKLKQLPTAYQQQHFLFWETEALQRVLDYLNQSPGDDC